MANTVELLLTAKDEMSKTLDGLKGKVDEAGGGIGGLGDKIAGLAGPLGAVGVAGMAAFEFKGAVDKVQEVGGEVTKLQRIVGGSAEDASRLRAEFERFGPGADAGAAAMARLSNNLEKNTKISDDGTVSMKGAAEKMKEFGVNVTDANGKILPMNELLPKISDVFKNMPNGPEKTALAMQLFGKTGAELLPFLNQGAEGMKKMGEESDKMGTTLSQGTLDALLKNKMAGKEFGEAMEGVQIQLGILFLPVMVKLAEVGAHLAESFNQAVVPAIKKVGEIMNDFVPKGATEALEKLMGLFAGPAAAGIAAAVAAFVLLKGALAITDIVQSAVKAMLSLDAAMDANPVGLITLAIAALVAGIVLLVQHWGELEEKFPVLQKATTAVEDAFHKLVDVIKEITGSTLFKDWLKTLGDAFQVVIDLLTGNWSKAWTDMQKLVGDALKTVGDAAKAFAEPVTTALGKVKDAIMGGFKEAWTWLSGDDGPKGWPKKIVDFFGSLKDDISKKLVEFKEGLTTGFKTAWDWVTGDDGPKGWPKKIIEFFSALKTDIGQKLTDFFEAAKNGFGTAWDWISGDEGPKGWPAKIIAFFDSLKNDITTKLGEFKDGVTDKMGEIWTWLSGDDGPKGWPGKIIHFFDTIKTDITTKLDEFKTGITDKATEIWNWLSGDEGPKGWPSKIVHFFDSLKGDITTKLGEFKQGIIDAATEAWTWISGDEGPKGWPAKIVAFFGTLKADMTNVGKDIVSGLGEGLKDFGNTVLTPFNAGINVINSFINGFNGLLGKFNAPPIPTIPALSVPGFAAGGSVDSSQYAMVGEAGPEIVYLPAGSEVIPNHMLGGFQGGTGGAAGVLGNVAGAVGGAVSDLIGKGFDALWNSLPKLNFGGVGGVVGGLMSGIGADLAKLAKEFLQHIFDQAKAASAAPAGGAGSLSGAQIVSLLKSVGFTGQGLLNALAVTYGESGWNPGITSPEDYDKRTGKDLGHGQGLWQFQSMGNSPSAAINAGQVNPYDPLAASKEAFKITGGGFNWGPWYGTSFLNNPPSWMRQLAGMADGGVVGSSGYFRVGERGPEGVRMGGSGGTYNITINVDASKLRRFDDVLNLIDNLVPTSRQYSLAVAR